MLLDLPGRLRRIFERALGGRIQSPGANYTPDLSMLAFLHFLEKKGEFTMITTRSVVDSEFTEIGYDVALWFRHCVGKRFFIHPRDVALATGQVQLRHPGWWISLIEFANSCLNSSLPIYASHGPRLDENFPWSDIPPGPGDDNLYSYQPHRFAFLPRIAMATYCGFVQPEKLRLILQGWMKEVVQGDNPFCYGTNLVVIQRLLSTAWAWLFLAARPSARTADGLGLEEMLIRIIWADVQFLEKRLGESARNNHLLADCFAGFFLNNVFPEFVNWPDRCADERFRDELLTQTYEDGGSFEHSAHYHEFACEMGAAYLLLCRKQGRIPDDLLRSRIEALLLFQIHLTGPCATPLQIGNATEDTLFPLDAGRSWCPGSLRELYRALFRPDYPSAPSDDSTRERAFWLLGGRLEPKRGANKLDMLPASMADAGLHVFPDHTTGGRLLFRSGPGSGVRVAAGHMHADFLSIYFAHRNWPVLVDAGTFTYRNTARSWPKGAPAWRSYLAGPSAHNTLTIQSTDPLGSLTRDFRDFDSQLRVETRTHFGDAMAWTEARMLDADIYTGYVRGCIHVESHYWIVYDSVPALPDLGEGSWFGFQFAPEIVLTVEGGKVVAHSPDGKSLLAMLSSLSDPPQLLEGSLDPLGGWVSRSYGQIVPAPQVRYQITAEHMPCAFVITNSGEVGSKAVRVRPLGGGLLGICVTTSVGQNWVVIANSSAEQPRVGSDDLFFDGELLWLSFEQSSLVQMRWIQGSTVRWPSRGIDVDLSTSTGEWFATACQE